MCMGGICGVRLTASIHSAKFVYIQRSLCCCCFVVRSRYPKGTVQCGTPFFKFYCAMFAFCIPPRTDFWCFFCSIRREEFLIVSLGTVLSCHAKNCTSSAWQCTVYVIYCASN